MTNTMKIATTRIADKGDNWHGPVVELTTDDNLTVTVRLPLVGDDNPGDPVERALAALVDLADASRRETEKRRSGGGDKADDTEEQLQEGLEDTFPASDPVSPTITTTLPKQTKEST